MKIRLTLAASSFALALLGANAVNASVILPHTPDSHGVGFLNFHNMASEWSGHASPGGQFESLSFPSDSHHVTANNNNFFGDGDKKDFEDFRPNQPQSNVPDSTAPISGVPEPATWAMFLAGFGAIGFMMRASRRTGSSASALKDVFSS